MAASTIARTTLTDDDGSGTTGTIYNNAFWQAAVYDKVDALLAGSSPATLEVGGSFKADTGFILSIVSKTANYTTLSTDDIVNCTANSFTVTLLTAVGRSGRAQTVKNTGTGTITMAATSSQTIDGLSAGSWTVPPGFALTFASDGANWILV